MRFGRKDKNVRVVSYTGTPRTLIYMMHAAWDMTNLYRGALFHEIEESVIAVYVWIRTIAVCRSKSSSMGLPNKCRTQHAAIEVTNIYPFVAR